MTLDSVPYLLGIALLLGGALVGWLARAGYERDRELEAGLALAEAKELRAEFLLQRGPPRDAKGRFVRWNIR